ncbi:MAG: glycosyltransferase [Candidatus Woesearchaeota archaeon]
MKVLIVAESFLPQLDGVSIFTTEVLAMLGKDFDLNFLVPAYTREKEYRGIPITTMPVFKPIKLKAGNDYYLAIPRIFKILAMVRKTDVVFLQSIQFLGIGSIIAAKIAKKPVIVYFHQYNWEQIEYLIPGPKWFKRFSKQLVFFLTRFFYNRCDLILVPSEQVNDKLAELDFNTRKMVVPMGIDPEKFKAPLSKARVKKAVGLKNTMVIGYCGRLSREKDIETLIAAFKKLTKKHKLQLLLVGATANETISGRNIRVTGFQKDVVPYYQAMDIFVSPSFTETTGLSIIEAMSCALPIVTTPVGIALTGISSGYNGLIFSKQSVEELVGHLETLIKSRKLRQKMGENARTTILEKYTYKDTIGQIQTILKSVIPET